MYTYINSTGTRLRNKYNFNYKYIEPNLEMNLYIYIYIQLNKLMLQRQTSLTRENLSNLYDLICPLYCWIGIWQLILCAALQM